MLRGLAQGFPLGFGRGNLKGSTTHTLISGFGEHILWLKESSGTMRSCFISHNSFNGNKQDAYPTLFKGRC